MPGGIRAGIIITAKFWWLNTWRNGTAWSTVAPLALSSHVVACNFQLKSKTQFLILVFVLVFIILVLPRSGLQLSTRNKIPKRAVIRDKKTLRLFPAKSHQFRRQKLSTMVCARWDGPRSKYTRCTAPRWTGKTDSFNTFLRIWYDFASTLLNWKGRKLFVAVQYVTMKCF